MVNSEELINQAKKYLSEWQDPREVIKFSDNTMNKLDSYSGEVSLRRSGLNFLLETYCGGFFVGIAKQSSSKKHYNKFRINKNDPPDFQIQTSQFEVENWELVECQLPCRKRGDEFKFPNDKIKLVYPNSMIQRRVIDANIDYLDRFLNPTAIKKAGKVYPPETKLLCYLTIDTGDSIRQEYFEKLSSGMEPAKDVFSEIWIIDHNWVVFPLWENGILHPEYKKCFIPKDEYLRLLFRLEND